MKTRTPIHYPIDNGLTTVIIPAGHPVRVADNLPLDANGEQQFWLSYVSQELCEQAPEGVVQSHFDNYGFLIQAADVRFTTVKPIDPVMQDAFTKAYLEAALWADGEDCDGAKATGFSQPFLRRAVMECRHFQDNYGELIAGRESTAGHDFWLIRQGHGAGFWDGDWPEHGDALDKACDLYGTLDVEIYEETLSSMQDNKPGYWESAPNPTAEQEAEQE